MELYKRQKKGMEQNIVERGIYSLHGSITIMNLQNQLMT